MPPPSLGGTAVMLHVFGFQHDRTARFTCDEILKVEPFPIGHGKSKVEERNLSSPKRDAAYAV